MNLELLNKIESVVYDLHGDYFDEGTYDDILLVVKYGLGMIEPNKLPWYLKDAVDNLPLTYKSLYNEITVNQIEYFENMVKNEPLWLQSCFVLDDLYRMLNH